MREGRFLKARRERWQRLESLLATIDRRGLRALSREEIEELALGYRAATSDLALATGRAYGATVIAYLNRLATRARAYVYLGTARSGWSRVVRVARETFPREVRRSWPPILVCVLITVVSAVLAYTSVRGDPANAYAFLSPDTVTPITKRLHDSNFAFDRTFSSAMASFIITNNIRVAAIAFAGGITAGVLTLLIILENGLMVGGLGALYANAGFGRDFWATISPHGVIELFAIQIAGGAGLLLALGIVAPGRLRRVDALMRNARRAVTLIAGVAGLLAVAGTIEGFISPQRLPEDVRFAIGALTAVALACYLGLAGRSNESQDGR
ncbi:MAG: stage II sporulation protein M [Candidatus Velthaea sp.]